MKPYTGKRVLKGNLNRRIVRAPRRANITPQDVGCDSKLKLGVTATEAKRMKRALKRRERRLSDRDNDI
jgi:hypothetical protein